ncbi:MAG: hypothetical protein FWG93_05785 [Oscillospiraceae bacterium]|nr:hypothetical protein [Oscillospiraceae bacterium]
MKQLVLGVDGGGTKSHLALFGLDGVCAAAFACGPLNHEVMEGGFQELETRLRESLRTVLDRAGAETGDIAYAVLGLAGVDTAAQHRSISAMLREAGLADFTLCNDAFLGVMAGCPGGVGICAINGTGTTIAAIDRAGTAVQVGGLGGITDDRGGGGWYAAQTVAAVYRELYKNGPRTALRESLFAALGVTRREDYIETLTGGMPDGVWDKINRLVFAAADAGDAAALDILARSAEHFAGAIAHLAGELDFPADETLSVTLAGSVFVRQTVRILPRMVERRVREITGRAADFLLLEVPPVAGAVLHAARRAGREIGPEAVRAGLAERLSAG